MKGPPVEQGRERGDSTSLGLLARVQARAAGSCEQLAALYTPLIYHWCRHAGLSPEDAKDVGQEVLSAVFRKLDSFRRDQEGQSFRGWLCTITRNKVRDHRDKAAHQAPAIGGSDALARIEAVPDPASEGDGDAIERASTDERRLLIHQALKQLEPAFKPKTWQMFWQVVYEGRSPAAVAAELGVNVANVYVAKSRVLQRFRDEFRDLVDPIQP